VRGDAFVRIWAMTISPVLRQLDLHGDRRAEKNSGTPTR